MLIMSSLLSVSVTDFAVVGEVQDSPTGKPAPPMIRVA